MLERLASGLVIVTGLIVTGVGIVAAIHHLRKAGRIYRRTETLYDGMPEGWSAWFVEGFSVFTIGSRWLWAIVVLIGSAVAGLYFVGIGCRLFLRT